MKLQRIISLHTTCKARAFLPSFTAGASCHAHTGRPDSIKCARFPIILILLCLPLEHAQPPPSLSQSPLNVLKSYKMSTVLGVIVIARNGDRREFYQDPKTYAPSLTDSTALGAVRARLFDSAGETLPVHRATSTSWAPSCAPRTSPQARPRTFRTSLATSPTPSKSESARRPAVRARSCSTVPSHSSKVSSRQAHGTRLLSRTEMS
jgi:hypothetical protein